MDYTYLLPLHYHIYTVYITAQYQRVQEISSELEIACTECVWVLISTHLRNSDIFNPLDVTRLDCIKCIKCSLKAHGQNMKPIYKAKALRLRASKQSMKCREKKRVSAVMILARQGRHECVLWRMQLVVLSCCIVGLLQWRNWEQRNWQTLFKVCKLLQCKGKLKEKKKEKNITRVPLKFTLNRF